MNCSCSHTNVPDLISKLKNDEDIYAIHVSAARTQGKDVEDDFFAQLFSQMYVSPQRPIKKLVFKKCFSVIRPLRSRHKLKVSN